MPSAPGYEPYEDVITGHRPGADAQAYAYEAPVANSGRREARHDFVPQRTRVNQRKRQTPVVPPDSVTSRSLTLVITIMCFLACLTAGAVYMINESKNAWLKDIASEMTAQVEPRDNVDIEKIVADVQAFLQRHSGIERATPVSLADSAKLLEPWLGKSDVLASLPVPRLIAVEIDRNTPPNVDALRAELAKQFQGVTLDDHRHWQRQIRTVTRSFALGGLGILLLVAAATTAVIISATRSAMASNREIIEVLHLVGATDRYIAREFEKHFLRLGIRAGLVGAACAMGVFLSMTAVMELLGGGDVTVAEVHRLIGTGGLDVAGYLILGGVVVIISALCMLTSRLGVFRVLNTKP
jgi:cell division transport system permease protein